MRRLTTLLLMLCCLALAAQERSYVLTVATTSDGDGPLFYADEIDSIGFTPAALVVHARGGGEQSFARSALRWVAFTADAHEAVELGLSVKWAACNVGGAAPQDYGSYYSWGETSPKTDYSESSYTCYSQGQYQYIGTNICGTSYDVARTEWGGHWRLPTRGEVRELATRCSWKAEELEGVGGYRVTGPSGNSIFLPSAGYQDGSGSRETGTGGFYWTGTLDRDMPSSAYNINFRGYDDEWSASRAYGFTVRAVR